MTADKQHTSNKCFSFIYKKKTKTDFKKNVNGGGKYYFRFRSPKEEK